MLSSALADAGVIYSIDAAPMKIEVLENMAKGIFSGRSNNNRYPE